MSKPFWQSKVLWFNVIAGVLVLVSKFGYADFVPDADVMFLMDALGNIALRFATNAPVTLR